MITYPITYHLIAYIVTDHALLLIMELTTFTELLNDLLLLLVLVTLCYYYCTFNDLPHGIRTPDLARK